PSVSISMVPSSSQPGSSYPLCSVLDFSPAWVQLRWFRGERELSGHVVATDMGHRLLVLLETPPRCGFTYTGQVEHVSLGHPLSWHW
ncbi:DQB2 protein, partial [Myiagra hebetior]|nr:DQB2 protein [Myiagra hebetior]